MKSNIVINDYIKADIVSDVLSQSISLTKKKLQANETKELRELLSKLLNYDEEVKKGNIEVMNKILKGEI